MATFEHDGTSIPTAPPKDPDSVMDYGGTFTTWLASGETISSIIVLINDQVASNGTAIDGLTVDSREFTDDSAKAWLSGGTLGTQYMLTIRIATSEGRTEDRTMIINCKPK